MRVLDPLDQRIVIALQVDGRASWTDIAALTGSSVTTVSRRGQQILQQGLIRIAAVPTVDQRTVEHLVVRLRCAPGSQARVAREIASWREVRSLALVTGVHDVVAEFMVPQERDLAQLLVRDVQRVEGVLSSEVDLILRTYKASDDWSRQILGEKAVAAARYPMRQPAYSRHPLDDLDTRILEALREDGRQSFQAVADQLGVHESTVRRRFEAMIAHGSVRLVTLAPAKLLGYAAEVIFWLDILPAHLDAAAQKLSRHQGVRHVAAMLGRDSLMCEVVLPSTRDLFAFTTETLASLDGVRAWRTSIELLTVKRGFVEAPWALSWLRADQAGPIGPAGVLGGRSGRVGLIRADEGRHGNGEEARVAPA